MLRGHIGHDGWILGLALTLALGVGTPAAHADGAAAIPVGSATLNGCPGDLVTFTLLGFYDNCALQPGFIQPPGGGCAIVYTGVASNGPGNFPAFFGPPASTGPRLDCTPPVVGGGIVQGTFTVTVQIPAGAAVGTTDSHTVVISICGYPTTVVLTTNVVACPGGGGGPGFPGAAGPAAGANLGNPGGGGGVLFNNGLGETAATGWSAWRFEGGRVEGDSGAPQLDLVVDPDGGLHALVTGARTDTMGTLVVRLGSRSEPDGALREPARIISCPFVPDENGVTQLDLQLPKGAARDLLVVQVLQEDDSAEHGVARSAAWSAKPSL